MPALRERQPTKRKYLQPTPPPARTATDAAPAAHIDTLAVLVAVTAFATAAFVSTTGDSVRGGDSGELMVVAKELGVAHPPGYPLWVLLSYGLEHVGVGMQYLSPVCGGLTVGVLFACAELATGSVAAGLLASALALCSRAHWRYATSPEVFALNNLLCAALLHRGLSYIVAPRRRATALYLASIVSALALANQHASVVFIAPSAAVILLHYVFVSEGYDGEKVAVLVMSALTFVAVLLGLYSQLYFAAVYSGSKHTWGATFDTQGFLVHVLRMEYGTFSLANERAGYAQTHFAASLQDWARHTAAELPSPALAALAAAGLAPWPFGARGRLAWVQGLLVLNVAAYLAFFGSLSNLPLDTELFRSVQERFWLQPYLVVCVAAGIGLHGLLAFAARVCGPRAGRAASCAAAMLVLAWCAAVVPTLHAEMDLRDNRVVEDFGRALLTPLARNSILLTKGDILTNSVRYAQAFKGAREDVATLDVEMLSAVWYVPRVRHFHSNVDVAYPGSFYGPRKGGFNARQFLEENVVKRQTAVYVAYDVAEKDSSWKQDFVKVPVGMADQFLPRAEAEAWSDKLAQRLLKRMRAAISEPMEATVLEAHTEQWEVVCVQDYWASLFRMGNFLALKASEKGAEPLKATPLLAEAASLLKRVVTKGRAVGRPYVVALSARLLSTVSLSLLQAAGGAERAPEVADGLTQDAATGARMFLAMARHESLRSSFKHEEIRKVEETLAGLGVTGNRKAP